MQLQRTSIAKLENSKTDASVEKEGVEPKGRDQPPIALADRRWCHCAVVVNVAAALSEVPPRLLWSFELLN